MHNGGVALLDARRHLQSGSEHEADMIQPLCLAESAEPIIPGATASDLAARRQARSNVVPGHSVLQRAERADSVEARTESALSRTTRALHPHLLRIT